MTTGEIPGGEQLSQREAVGLITTKLSSLIEATLAADGLTFTRDGKVRAQASLYPGSGLDEDDPAYQEARDAATTNGYISFAELRWREDSAQPVYALVSGRLPATGDRDKLLFNLHGADTWTTRLQFPDASSTQPGEPEGSRVIIDAWEVPQTEIQQLAEDYVAIDRSDGSEEEKRAACRAYDQERNQYLYPDPSTGIPPKARNIRHIVIGGSGFVRPENTIYIKSIIGCIEEAIAAKIAYEMSLDEVEL